MLEYKHVQKDKQCNQPKKKKIKYTSMKTPHVKPCIRKKIFVPLLKLPNASTLLYFPSLYHIFISQMEMLNDFNTT